MEPAKPRIAFLIISIVVIISDGLIFRGLAEGVTFDEAKQLRDEVRIFPYSFIYPCVLFIHLILLMLKAENIDGDW